MMSTSFALLGRSFLAASHRHLSASLSSSVSRPLSRPLSRSNINTSTALTTRVSSSSPFTTSLRTSSSQQLGPTLRYLILDGYTLAGREDLEQGGATTGGNLYARMLRRCAPVHTDVQCDIVYPMDADFDAHGFGVSSATSTPSDAPLGHRLSDYDGVCWTGCSLTVMHAPEEPLIQLQIDLVRDVMRRGIPQFGSCWAAQIACVAVGGVCDVNPNGREMGISRKILLNDEGRAHPMFEGKPTAFDAWTSHNDIITLAPPNTRILASNAWSPIQAVVINSGSEGGPQPGRTGERGAHLGTGGGGGNGEFWSVQYHPEYDLQEVSRLTYCRLKRAKECGYIHTIADGEQFVRDLQTLHDDPSRTDIKWKYSLDGDVLDDDTRQREVINWINKQVMPYHMLRTYRQR